MNEPNEILEPIIERRRAGISWIGVILGLIIGLGLGLFYSREVEPVVVRNVSPADLNPQDKQIYIAAVAREYAATGDLEQAVGRLLEVDPNGDPLQLAADTVCDLIRSGQIDTVSNIDVIRSLRAIYEPQGVKANCDVTAFNTPIPVTAVLLTPTLTLTPSLTPVATKTPNLALPPNVEPTLTPTLATENGMIFRPVLAEPFCDATSSGVIEVYVRDINGHPLPGTALEVTWNSLQSRETFYTGLKPERGDDYADYQMTEGQTYHVSVLGRASQPTNPLDATACDGSGTLWSYRIIIEQEEQE